MTDILLVDDDARIRRFVHAVLTYGVACSGITAEVIEATDYEAALHVSHGVRRPIDLLISDVRLGSGRSGVDLAREMSQMNPRLRVLLMSGNDIPASSLPGDWRFLAKPFRVEDLVNCVNALCA